MAAFAPASLPADPHVYLYTLVLVGLGAAVGSWRARSPFATRRPLAPVRAIYLPFVALGVQAWALRGDDGSHRLGLMALSFVLLFAFTWQNRKHRPMLLLLAGLLLNMAPMLLHNGYMPITPETLATLFPSAPENWPLGLVRPGSKDIVASAADSPLWFLGDVFALASPFPMPTAFSIGDLVIMGGYLWSAIHFTGQTTSLPVTAK